MIDIELLKKDIKDSLNDVKSSLINDKIKFSRIEEYFSDKKFQWLLSIVLIKSYNNDEVDEIVIELNVIIQKEFLILNADLSLGNGFILKEKSIKINIGINDQREIINDLRELFFKSINNEIYQAINNLD